MANSLIESYLQTRDPAAIAPGFLAYLANLECVARVAPEVARSIVQELADQRHNIKLIASENFSSLATQCAMANLLTDKYAEGIPHHRFYAGCDNVDSIEDLANQRARELFGAAHAYAQPHSGADANLVAFWAILRARVELAEMAEILGAEGPDALAAGDWYKLTPEQWNAVRQALGNQRLLGLDLASGGPPDPRLPAQFVGQDVRVARLYGRSPDVPARLRRDRATGPGGQAADPAGRLQRLFAEHQLRPDARDRRPVGAVLDGRHGPLRRAGRRESARRASSTRSRYAHVVTTTTHKTLRGPRGGLGAVHRRVQGRTSTAAARWCWEGPCPT